MMFFWKSTPAIFYLNCLFCLSIQRDLSNGLSWVSNGDNMTKSQAREVGYPTHPNGAHKLLV